MTRLELPSIARQRTVVATIDRSVQRFAARRQRWPPHGRRSSTMLYAAVTFTGLSSSCAAWSIR